MLSGATPMLALAPMQDVTDLPFWKLMTAYGGADVYFTEYFRVHSTSNLEKYILKSITENPTDRPVVAQMIGNDVPSLVRTARELQQYPIAAVDLNLGCPAPVVYRKCAGGGLLREPERVDSILGALRDAVKIKFTVKTRIGFDSPHVFDAFLPIFAKHSLDLLTVHGRTVYEMYRTEVHYDYIARAVAAMPCPVLANGNVYSAQKAEEILKTTGAHGLMIGRGAIRNPWLFHQIRQRVVVARASRPCDSEAHCVEPTHGRDARATMFVPRGHDVLGYIRALYDAVCSPDVSESAQVQKMKKYMNYLGVGVDSEGQFLHHIRRVTTEADFFRVCEQFLNHDRPMPLEPFPLKLKETDVMATE
ncbi:MAG TPA: tRNA-dihydrouridine synthase family protein [Candidatus Polarisedimenticolia bacterium]|nr:tRNA-dihydrouridine synthase family protein [Candidatus Polarisedimenticolia bacterium]